MQPFVSQTGHLTGSQSVAEAIVTQLLVDSLANARHVLLSEVQGLVHGEAAAVL